MEKDIIILAIDTSCDETSAAVIKNGREVLSNIISSQIETHTAFGGVVPEIASRKHMENIDIVVDEALVAAKVSINEIDAISATYGPGLVGALLTGLLFAKAMAYALDKPFIGVNHIEGHICSNYLETDWEPPFICLVVSGGHTNLIRVNDYGQYETLGETRDDAAGEAYDKVARVLGLQYPGGPRLDALAQKGDGNAIRFPRASIAENEYDFSFSGVKSAVLNYINKCEMTGQEIVKEDIAAGFQEAVVDVLVQKTINSLNKTGINKVALAGGVACNSEIRRALKKECAKTGLLLNIPKPVFCTDNGAMIGSAAYYKYLRGESSAPDLNAAPSVRL